MGEPVISIEEDLLARGVELAKQDEEVHVVAFRGRDPQRERHCAGQFGIVLEAVDEARPIARTAERVVLDHTLIGREFGSKLPGHGIQRESVTYVTSGSGQSVAVRTSHTSRDRRTASRTRGVASHPFGSPFKKWSKKRRCTSRASGA